VSAEGGVRVTLLCWNLAGRVKRLAEQAALVQAAGADVVCLQEVTPTSARRWGPLLREAGFTHLAIAGTAAALREGRSRPLHTLTASKLPLAPLPVADVWLCVLEAQQGIGRSAVQRTACLGMVAALARGKTAGERC